MGTMFMGIACDMMSQTAVDTNYPDRLAEQLTENLHIDVIADEIFKQENCIMWSTMKEFNKSGALP
jgi:hypothetical protein